MLSSKDLYNNLFARYPHVFFHIRAGERVLFRYSDYAFGRGWIKLLTGFAENVTEHYLICKDQGHKHDDFTMNKYNGFLQILIHTSCIELVVLASVYNTVSTITCESCGKTDATLGLLQKAVSTKTRYQLRCKDCQGKRWTKLS